MELFETTGQVELAEILFDGTRSKGCGVVQFAQVPEAETAIGMQYLRFSLVFSNHGCLSQIPALYVWWSSFGYVSLLFFAVDLLMNTLYLDVRFNDRWHTFTPSAAKGGQVAPMQADMV